MDKAVFPPESVTTSATEVGGSSCSNVSSTKKTVSCSSTGENSSASGSTSVQAENGWGTKKMSTSTEITFLETFTGVVSSFGNEETSDFLSIVGLKNEPVAYLKLETDERRSYRKLCSGDDGSGA
jgi:hypothetical protein